MSYSVRRVSSEEEFTSLRASWDELLARSVDANTFLSHAWLHAWWRNYRPAARLTLLLSEKAGRLVGIAPLMLSREGTVGRMFRRLRFVGDGTSETDHMNFVVDEEDRALVLEGLLQAINELPWDIAHFNHLPETSANTRQLLDYADARGWLTTTTLIACPRRGMPQTSADLMRSLPSRLRTSIRSARRELARTHAVEFGLVREPEELPAALETLFKNHSGRWQAKGGAGVFVDERKRSFYRDLSGRLLERGSLRFFYLRLNEATVAQQYCFEHKGTVYLLQEGFNFEFARNNVGNVLRAMVFEHLIEHGTQTYDFLAGTSRHKLSWSDGVSNDLTLRACRRSMAGHIAYRAPGWLAKLRRPASDGRDA